MGWLCVHLSLFAYQGVLLALADQTARIAGLMNALLIFARYPTVSNSTFKSTHT
jgi:hypothetical protein